MEKEGKRPKPINSCRRREMMSTGGGVPESPRGPMEFLSRSWSVSAAEISRALQTSNSNKPIAATPASSIPEDPNADQQLTFAASATSQLVLERIMSQSEVSPLTSGRLSHSSGPLNGGSSLTGTDSPPISPSDDFDDVVKNAQVHAAVSVAAVASAVAAIAAATAASSSGKNEQTARIDMAVASAAALVAAQCVEAAETMGAERDHLTSVVSSAVNVRSHDDIVTLNAAAATALRGAATLKARALKEVWNVAAVLPTEKATTAGLCGQVNTKQSDSSFSGELPVTGEEFLSICNQELLAKGTELLKRTRGGDLHWKIVSVYINKAGQVVLKLKSKHVGGTFTKKKKHLVLEVKRDIPAWPGRDLFNGGEQRYYFGLKTETKRVIEFECRNQREYDIWTQGVSRLLAIASIKKQRDSTFGNCPLFRNLHSIKEMVSLHR